MILLFVPSFITSLIIASRKIDLLCVNISTRFIPPSSIPGYISSSLSFSIFLDQIHLLIILLHFSVLFKGMILITLMIFGTMNVFL